MMFLLCLMLLLVLAAWSHGASASPPSVHARMRQHEALLRRTAVLAAWPHYMQGVLAAAWLRDTERISLARGPPCFAFCFTQESQIDRNEETC